MLLNRPENLASIDVQKRRKLSIPSNSPMGQWDMPRNVHLSLYRCVCVPLSISSHGPHASVEGQVDIPWKVPWGCGMGWTIPCNPMIPWDRGIGWTIYSISGQSSNLERTCEALDASEPLPVCLPYLFSIPPHTHVYQPHIHSTIHTFIHVYTHLRDYAQEAQAQNSTHKCRV